ncbi:hypothetical protein BC833DRAFT_582832 [Globomyces pollinis-pini]|nr:hypothetical protein BC833DRAFT_582832 [Globomyces pollinis-pini]
MCVRFARRKKLGSINCVYNGTKNVVDYGVESSHNLSNSTINSTTSSKDILRFDSDVQNHLLQLSSLSLYAYIPFGDDFNRFLNPNRLSKMPDNLKRSFMYPSLIYSTHPKLFPTPESLEMQNKINFAKSFKVHWELDIPQLKNDLITVQCDEIRAHLGLSIFLFQLGEVVESRKMIRDMLDLARELGFYNSQMLLNLPRNAVNQNIVSMEDLVKLVHPLNLNSPVLSQEDYFEIYSLIAFLYNVNCINLPEGSMRIGFDENLLTSICLTVPIISEPIARYRIPDLAKYTIWENSQWAPMFDEMKEAVLAYPKLFSDACSLLDQSIRIDMLFKRAVSYSKRYTYEKGEFDSLELASCHEEVLKILKEIPEDLAYFDSLSNFIFGADMSTLSPPTAKCHQLVVSKTLLCLGCLSYLHLSGAQQKNRTLYPAYSGGPPLFLSKDILFAVAKALGFVVKEITTRFLPCDSVYGEYRYSVASLESGDRNPLNSTLPSPMCLDPSFAYIFFVVSSSCLLGVRCYPQDVEQDAELRSIIVGNIVQGLKSLSYIWPSASLTIVQLQKLIQ